MRRKAIAWLALVLSPGSAAAQDEWGEEFKKADPVEKLVRISVAAADRKLTYSKSQEMADQVVLEEMAKAEGSAKKLQRLGELRSKAAEKIKALNEERRKAKKGWVSLREPTSNLQAAVALKFVADTAGPKPSLEALGCLKTVRENTSWIGHSYLVLAWVQEVLQRDKAYLAADHKGKLGILRKLTDREQILSNQESVYLEYPIVCDWVSGAIKGGKSVDEILASVQALYREKAICFFTWSRIGGLLKAMKSVK